MKFCPTCKSKFPTDINYCPNDATKLVLDPEVGPSHSLIGMILDNRYRIISKLGEGGMGSVYAAEHVLLKKNVAIKILRYDLARREDVVRRFQNEAIAASRIGHENIIEVTDFGRTPDGSVYFVMEYLNGSSLSEVIQTTGSIPIRRAIPILLQITKALSVAHSQGIIHRDLKPENIVLIDKPDRKDFVKILDFGISKMLDTSDRAEKLTAMGMIVGTPEYMSPEQAAGMSVDKRTDIYSLGVIMYEMMTGRLPFLADNAIRILMMHQTEKPVSPREINPAIHIGMEQIILKCMEKKPEDRFQDMTEITQALVQLLSSISKPQEVKKTIAFNPQVITPSQSSTLNQTSSFQKTSQEMSSQVISRASQENIPIGISPKINAESNLQESVESQEANRQSDLKKTLSGQVQAVGPKSVTSNELNISDNVSVQSNLKESSLTDNFYKTDTAYQYTDKGYVEESEQKTEEQASKSRTVIILGVVVLSLMILGGGVYYFIFKGKTANSNVSAVSEKTQQETKISSQEVNKEEPKVENKQVEIMSKVSESDEKKDEQAQTKEIKTAKAVEQVVLSITSEPENVEIYRGGVMVGVTPYQLKGRKNSTSEFIFRKAGYEPVKKRITFTNSGEIRINLKRIEEKRVSPQKEKDPFEKIDDLKDLSF